MPGKSFWLTHPRASWRKSPLQMGIKAIFAFNISGRRFLPVKTCQTMAQSSPSSRAPQWNTIGSASFFGLGLNVNISHCYTEIHLWKPHCREDSFWKITMGTLTLFLGLPNHMVSTVSLIIWANFVQVSPWIWDMEGARNSGRWIPCWILPRIVDWF